MALLAAVRFEPCAEAFVRPCIDPSAQPVLLIISPNGSLVTCDLCRLATPPDEALNTADSGGETNMSALALRFKTNVDMLRVRLQVRLSGIQSQLLETEEAVESVEVDNAFPVAGDNEFLFLTVRSSSELSEEQFSAELADTEVAHMAQAAVNEHTYYLAVMVDRSGRSVLSLLTENRAIPHQIIGQNAHISVVASVRDWQHLKRVAGAIEGAHGSLELIGTTRTDQIGYPLGSDKLRQTVSGKLSDQQLSVLETAYEMGFFRVPQEVTAGEIASELDISRSTLSERLHRVQHDLCELLFGS